MADEVLPPPVKCREAAYLRCYGGEAMSTLTRRSVTTGLAAAVTVISAVALFRAGETHRDGRTLSMGSYPG